MTLQRINIQVDKPEAKKAVSMAREAKPDFDISLSGLVRILLRKYVRGDIKL